MARLVIVLAQAQHIQVDPPGFDCGGVIKGLAHRQQGLLMPFAGDGVTRTHAAGDRTQCLNLGVLPVAPPWRAEQGGVAVALAQKRQQALVGIAPQVDHVLHQHRGSEHTVRFAWFRCRWCAVTAGQQRERHTCQCPRTHHSHPSR